MKKTQEQEQPEEELRSLELSEQEFLVTLYQLVELNPAIFPEVQKMLNKIDYLHSINAGIRFYFKGGQLSFEPFNKKRIGFNHQI